MMAGSASTNPVLFVLAVLLMLAWKNAGWIGLDRWLLPALGTPWQPGRFFSLRRRPAAA
jgi:thiosulfate dehydrogenase [quinone] large subunit